MAISMLDFGGTSIRYDSRATAFIRPDGRELVLTLSLRDEVVASFKRMPDGTLRFLPNYGIASVTITADAYTIALTDVFAEPAEDSAPAPRLATIDWHGFRLHYDDRSTLFTTPDDTTLLLSDLANHEVNLALHVSASGALVATIGYGIRLFQHGAHEFAVRRNDIDPLSADDAR